MLGQFFVIIVVSVLSAKALRFSIFYEYFSLDMVFMICFILWMKLDEKSHYVIGERDDGNDADQYQADTIIPT